MPPTTRTTTLTTPWRPATLAAALVALVAVLLPLGLGPSATAAATGAEPERALRYLSSAEVRYTLASRLVLTQDTATSRRASLLAHAWNVDTGGTRAAELIVFLGRKSKRPAIYRARDFSRVPCRAASRERFSGGSGSTITVPGACLRDGSRPPRTVTVQAQTTVLVTRRGNTSCRTETSRRLGPYDRGEGGGFFSRGSGGVASSSDASRLRPPTPRGC